MITAGNDIIYQDEMGATMTATVEKIEIRLDTRHPHDIIKTHEIPYSLIKHPGIVIHLNNGDWIRGVQVISAWNTTFRLTA